VIVRRVRELELALGDGVKSPTPAEREKQHRLRRGSYDAVTLEPASSADALWLRPQWRIEDLPPEQQMKVAGTRAAQPR